MVSITLLNEQYEPYAVLFVNTSNPATVSAIVAEMCGSGVLNGIRVRSVDNPGFHYNEYLRLSVAENLIQSRSFPFVCVRDESADILFSLPNECAEALERYLNA